MRRSLFLISASLAGNALAQKMSDRFTVSSTCSGKDVDSVLTEALDMANVASKAIDSLLNSNINPTFGNKAVKPLVQAAHDVWGVSLPTIASLGSFSSADQQQLKAAQSTNHSSFS